MIPVMTLPWVPKGEDETRLQYLRRCNDYLQKQSRRCNRRQRRRRQQSQQSEQPQLSGAYHVVVQFACLRSHGLSGRLGALRTHVSDVLRFTPMPYVAVGRHGKKADKKQAEEAQARKLVTKLEKELKNANSAVQELQLGGCQSSGPSLGPYYNTPPNI